MDDIILLLIYLLIFIVGAVTTAYRNKSRKKAAASAKGAQKDFPSPAPFDMGDELGPLGELFGLPSGQPVPAGRIPTLEEGPSLEDEGYSVEKGPVSSTGAEIMAGREQATLEKLGENAENIEQEGQSDIQKMIAGYAAIQRKLDPDNAMGDIITGDITTTSGDAGVSMQQAERKFIFNLKDAIIFSEILKRREF